MQKIVQVQLQASKPRNPDASKMYSSTAEGALRRVTKVCPMALTVTWMPGSSVTYIMGIRVSEDDEVVKK